jgi:hypothetical protein
MPSDAREPPSPDESGDDAIQQCERRSRGAAKKARAMDCVELLAKIKELMDTEKVGRSGTKGLIQRFRDYLGDDSTHGTAIENQQAALRAYLDEYDNKDCGDPPPGAPELASRPLPAPAPTRSSGEAARTAAEAGAAVGLGYVVYRILRMLPSLAPPLWWTIPENAAIP